MLSDSLKWKQQIFIRLCLLFRALCAGHNWLSERDKISQKIVHCRRGEGRGISRWAHQIETSTSDGRVMEIDRKKGKIRRPPGMSHLLAISQSKPNVNLTAVLQIMLRQHTLALADQKVALEKSLRNQRLSKATSEFICKALHLSISMTTCTIYKACFKV